MYAREIILHRFAGVGGDAFQFQRRGILLFSGFEGLVKFLRRVAFGALSAEVRNSGDCASAQFAFGLLLLEFRVAVAVRPAALAGPVSRCAVPWPAVFISVLVALLAVLAAAVLSVLPVLALSALAGIAAHLAHAAIVAVALLLPAGFARLAALLAILLAALALALLLALLAFAVQPVERIVDALFQLVESVHLLLFVFIQLGVVLFVEAFHFVGRFLHFLLNVVAEFLVVLALLLLCLLHFLFKFLELRGAHAVLRHFLQFVAQHFVFRHRAGKLLQFALQLFQRFLLLFRSLLVVVENLLLYFLRQLAHFFRGHARIAHLQRLGNVFSQVVLFEIQIRGRQFLQPRREFLAALDAFLLLFNLAFQSAHLEHLSFGIVRFVLQILGNLVGVLDQLIELVIAALVVAGLFSAHFFQIFKLLLHALRGKQALLFGVAFGFGARDDAQHVLRIHEFVNRSGQQRRHQQPRERARKTHGKSLLHPHGGQFARRFVEERAAHRSVGRVAEIERQRTAQTSVQAEPVVSQHRGAALMQLRRKNAPQNIWQAKYGDRAPDYPHVDAQRLQREEFVREQKQHQHPCRNGKRNRQSVERRLPAQPQQRAVGIRAHVPLSVENFGLVEWDGAGVHGVNLLIGWTNPCNNYFGIYGRVCQRVTKETGKSGVGSRQKSRAPVLSPFMTPDP